MANAPSPAAAYVPRLPMRRTPHFFENDAAPREWSVCSWERTMPAKEAGSIPADSRRSAMSRAARPASMRMRVSPDSMTVVLPELPDPRTRNRTAGCYPTSRPRRDRHVADSEKSRGGGGMLETLVLSLALQSAPPGRAVPRLDREEVEEFLEEVEEYVEHRRKAREELPKLKDKAEPEDVTAYAKGLADNIRE